MLQEWLGHRDYKTTAIYADYAPSEHEAALIERAFGHQSERNWGRLAVVETALASGVAASGHPGARVVVQAVAGSSPVAHPPQRPC
jgi:hypothetical protein